MDKLVMRELRGDDLFPLIHIFGKINIVDDIVELFETRETIVIKDPKDKEEIKKLEADIAQRGVKIMGKLVNKLLMNLPLVKDELNDFLAELCHVTRIEMEQLGLVEKTNLIVDFFKKPELAGFFNSIAPLLSGSAKTASILSKTNSTDDTATH